MNVSASKHFSAQEDIERMKAAADFLRYTSYFSPAEYINNKIHRLNEYFDKYDITDVVIGISGGLDSAVVYKLLKECDVKVHPLFVAIWDSPGIRNQPVAYNFAKQLIPDTSEWRIINITDISEYINEKIFPMKTAWGRGQVDYLLRMPIFYGYVAQLQEQERNAVVVGTTNKSEAMLGYFGKTSDNAVDIQPIWDLMKWQEFEVAKLLEVPKSIIERVPTGDTHDGLTDEEIFGFPYWFLEVWNVFTNHPWYERVLNLRKKNSHKFDAEGNPKTGAVVI